jgi:hypothetical protein
MDERQYAIFYKDPDGVATYNFCPTIDALKQRVIDLNSIGCTDIRCYELIVSP